MRLLSVQIVIKSDNKIIKPTFQQKSWSRLGWLLSEELTVIDLRTILCCQIMYASLKQLSVTSQTLYTPPLPRLMRLA